MARIRTQMKDALAAAGVRATVCPVHQTLKPCAECDLTFDRAERQKHWHDRHEGRRLHAEWVKSRRAGA